MNDPKNHIKVRIVQSFVMVFTVAVIVLTVFSVNAYAGHSSDPNNKAKITDPNAAGIEQARLELQKTQAEEMKFAFIAAAIAFGLGALGAGFAISHVGAAAMGAIAEKPEVAGQAMIFVALGEGIAVFGMVIAILIILKV
ncbi:MAG: hypothetical protein JXA96_14250 [Sedimentisphaerales bacterium]|nr:hypothetical protein [Sedimentisphaerales bacterium]